MTDNAKECIVTTSWDDGHIHDLRCFDLLQTFGVRGTFYVCSKNAPNTLPPVILKHLSESQEIGAHTVDHPVLTTLGERDIRYQLTQSKLSLEQQLGTEVCMFCYPRGEHNSLVRKIAAEAGFVGARTTASFNLQYPSDAYMLSTTLRIFPFPFVPQLQDAKTSWEYALLRQYSMWKSIWKAGLSISAYVNWGNLARATFDQVLTNGGVWHMWGHSWEVERYAMWGELERILEYVSHRKNVKYLTNGELIAYCAARPLFSSAQ